MMRFVKSLLFSSTFVLLATAQRGNNDNRPRLPSLWEIILMPSSSQNGGPSNYNNARSTSTTESSTKKLNVGSSRENNEEEDLNKSFWLPKTTKKKKKRVLIDLSYTLGCTREGYFPLARSCFHFLHCQKSSSSSIDYRGFVFRCPNGFRYVHNSDYGKGPRCQPLSKAAKCDQNTNDATLDVPRDII